jgi:predicted GNAT superfamily acetyltransferase
MLRAPAPAASCEVRELGPADHAALVALSRTSSTGSELFRVDRSRDFFALGELLGQTRYHGVLEAGALIACLAVSEQLRFVGGASQAVAYVHDVRVDPRHAGRGVLRRLVQALSEAYRPRFAWLFCTVLGDNPHAAAVRAAGARFGAERLLGETLHVGIPVQRSRAASGLTVERASRVEAWTHYERLARSRDLAPADAARFAREPGECLVLQAGGRVLSVAKCVEQSRARRLVATRALGLPARLLSALLARRGAARLADRGEELRIAYLSHLAGEVDAHEAARAFASFVARAAPGRHSHVFFGVAPHERRRSSRLGVVQLASRTYGYGALPASLSLGFRELSWI